MGLYKSYIEKRFRRKLEGIWLAEYKLTSFVAAYYDRSRYEEAEFNNKEVELIVEDLDEIVFLMIIILGGG